MIRRVQGANNFGVNERFERFFEEIDLPVLELQARKRALTDSLFDPTLSGLTEADLLSIL